MATIMVRLDLFYLPWVPSGAALGWVSGAFSILFSLGEGLVELLGLAPSSPPSPPSLLGLIEGEERPMLPEGLGEVLGLILGERLDLGLAPSSPPSPPSWLSRGPGELEGFMDFLGSVLALRVFLRGVSSVLLRGLASVLAEGDDSTLAEGAGVIEMVAEGLDWVLLESQAAIEALKPKLRKRVTALEFIAAFWYY
jgi:hypothetical protein